MNGPGYTWTCHACEQPNSAESAACANCGISANATAIEIARATRSENPIKEAYSTIGKALGGILAWLGGLSFWWW